MAWIHFGWGCFPQLGDLTILRITPSVVSPETDTLAPIQGRHLQNRVRLSLDDDRPAEVDRRWAVRVGGTDARDVALVDASTLSLVIPAGLPLGASADAGGTPCTEFSPPEMLTGFGLTDDLFGPTLSFDALELIFAESGATEAVFSARRSDRGLDVRAQQRVG